VVYAKRPFAGPEAVLAYLSRYTHRVAISNTRLLALDEHGVSSFRWKGYRSKGKTRDKAMTLSPEEFMRRFLLHVLPGGLHRIRHYGLLANGSRTASLALARELLCAPKPQSAPRDDADASIKAPAFVCQHCGRTLLIVQTFTRGQTFAHRRRRQRHEHHRASTPTRVPATFDAPPVGPALRPKPPTPQLRACKCNANAAVPCCNRQPHRPRRPACSTQRGICVPQYAQSP
jgi:hypothetical protein